MQQNPFTPVVRIAFVDGYPVEVQRVPTYDEDREFNGSDVEFHLLAETLNHPCDQLFIGYINSTGKVVEVVRWIQGIHESNIS